MTEREYERTEFKADQHTKAWPKPQPIAQHSLREHSRFGTGAIEQTNPLGHGDAIVAHEARSLVPGSGVWS